MLELGWNSRNTLGLTFSVVRSMENEVRNNGYFHLPFFPRTYALRALPHLNCFSNESLECSEKQCTAAKLKRMKNCWIEIDAQSEAQKRRNMENSWCNDTTKHCGNGKFCNRLSSIIWHPMRQWRVDKSKKVNIIIIMTNISGSIEQ